MAIYTERVQTVLTDEQYKKLTDLSQQTGKAVSVLIRDAIEDTYFADMDRSKRRAALAQLLALEAPVADWETMENEIIAGAIDHNG